MPGFLLYHIFGFSPVPRLLRLLTHSSVTDSAGTFVFVL